MKQISMLLLGTALTAGACTQTPASTALEAPSQHELQLASISQEELRKDLFELSSDAMRGKRAGTVDELRAAAWVAEQARNAGLEPAGEDGTYFQFFPISRMRVADNSTISINQKPAKLWQQVWVTNPAETRLDAPVVWLNSLADTAKHNLKGKVIAMLLQAPEPLPAAGMSLWNYRYVASALRQQSNALKNQKAAAILLVTDPKTEGDFGFMGHVFEEGTYALESDARRQNNSAPVLLAHASIAPSLQQAGAKLTTDIRVDTYTYPSMNVVAKAPGSDPNLKEEYVLFSGHHDHDGIGAPVDGDSIYNGADDNASVTVALLAIGRSWVKNPGKRSALFVWHGAEERGLFGSRWFVEHPTVDKSSIVAVLNGDMIGRNAPDSAALLGSIPPHRNSNELVDMALQANKQHTNFSIDTSWDEASHPENWYFRSDHLPYAQAGIPAIFFTTLLHPDYHTPRDEAERIDLEKLTRMTRWMYATGWTVSETPERPTVDPNAKLER
ncbi:M28 family peptidase [Pontibacter sp. E15-1]|uniref:M28 family peptidase n=1 Tax=Pontibacter sp. E15-1 TaxID=2919918 RepID=UPI001F4F4B33|nr:M28 family peptidase [Pontibacter sp. E15-1]MCJ8165835.1 M28 family peptidase [Pontibacter sp. E15-1]